MRNSLADRRGWSSEYKSQLGGSGVKDPGPVTESGLRRASHARPSAENREGRTRLAFGSLSVCKREGGERAA